MEPGKGVRKFHNERDVCTFQCRESRGEEWDIHEGAGMLLRWEAVVLEKGATLSSTVQRKQEGRGVSPGGGQRGVAHGEAPVGSKRRLRL